MGWAELGLWISLLLTGVILVLAVSALDDDDRGYNNDVGAVVMFGLALVMFLVTCLFGHLGDVPTITEFWSNRP